MRYLLAVLAVAVACSGDDGPLTPDEVTSVRMAVVSGDGETDTIEATVDVVVRASGEGSGRPVSGQAVSFGVSDTTCGSFSPEETETGDDGTASAQWRLGAVAQRCSADATATAPGGTAEHFASLEVEVLPGEPYYARRLRSVSHVRFLADSIDWSEDIGVYDRESNPVPDVEVELLDTASAEVDSIYIWSEGELGIDPSFLAAGDTVGWVPLTWLLPIPEYDWGVETACVAGDSIHISASVDSIYFYYDPYAPGTGEMFFGGTRTEVTQSDTTVADTSFSQSFEQRPGEIRWKLFPGETFSTADSDVPTEYTGGDWCDGGWSAAFLTLSRP